MIIPKPTDPRFIDLTGHIFTDLTVLGYTGRQPGNSFWLCVCVCGNERIVTGGSLRSGGTKSCGCTRKERNRLIITKHGESLPTKTPEYRAYLSARARCSARAHCHKRYADRGIKFCFSSYLEFLAEVGRKPTPEHSLDRINNDGNYEKGNIRWATRAEQHQNKTQRKAQLYTGV